MILRQHPAFAMRDVIREIQEHETEEGRPLEQLIITPQQYAELEADVDALSKYDRQGDRPKTLVITFSRSACTVLKGP